jgi:hypothetical protein
MAATDEIPGDLMARLDRARELYEALATEERAFTASRPLRPEPRFDRPTGWNIVTARVVREPPVRLGLLVGEVVHHLRATLDNLVTWVARRNGGAGGRTSFPVFSVEGDYRRRRDERLVDIPEPIKFLIDQMQPFHGHERGQRLAAINDLDVDDKHQVLFSAWAMLTHVNVGLGDSAESELIMGEGPIVEDGQELYRVRVRAPATMVSKPDVRYTIVFGAKPGLGDGPDKWLTSSAMLPGLIDEIEAIVREVAMAPLA